MDRDEIKAQLKQLREMKQKAIEVHGYDFCENSLYDEMLEKENNLLSELMKAEPSKVSEATFRSRWD